MARIILKTAAGRFGALAAGFVFAAAVWVGLGGSMQAAPPAPDPVTCVPTCEIDGRSLVSAGDDNTTLSSQEIVLGLSFTAAAGPDGNFELFDGDRDQTNWDVLFNCGNGCPGNGAAAPELIVELFADPAGIGGAGAPLMVWSPDTTPFPTANNGWAGITFPHDASAINGTDYLYALHVRPFNPENDKGWNSFKVRAAGTVILLGNQVVGFLGAMNNPGDLTTIYPHWNELPVGSNLTDSPYDGTWVFKTRLPAFLGDVTVFDGDMDFGNAACAYNDTDDSDSSNAAVPPFAFGSAAVPEGVAVANAPNACPSPPGGTRTGTPAEDASSAAFRRVPSIIPAGIAYQLKAPGTQANPNGQIFLNQNPSGNKEWEQFKIQLVDPGDVTNGACPLGGYPEDLNKGYAKSDCRTTDLPGGVWEIQLDGMDLSNLNFWFFSFKVEPIDVEYSIGRLVWYDANVNQQQDMCGPDPCAEEHGIGGVAYTVYHFETPGIPDGTVARTGFTNSDPNHLTLRVGEFLEEGLPAGNYRVEVDASNFAAAAPLNGLTSTTGGEIENGIEVGLPVCTDTGVPAGCGQPEYNEAIFGYVQEGVCLAGPIGGINLGSITNNLFFFENGTISATWEGASPGYVGNVLANALVKEKTSGGVAYAGTISTGDTKLDAWQKIVDDNPGQSAVSTGNGALVASHRASLLAAFAQIDGLVATVGYTNRTPTSLNNLNTTNGVSETLVINIRSGFATSTQINITGDPGDVFVLRWDTDANSANGYQGKVKFSGGGGIVPLGGLTAANFIHVAGAITSSGGGTTPPPPFPQGPRLDNGTGNLITGAHDFNGGGFFTGYWLTTGELSMSNGIFVGGLYTIAEKINMTSGTAGVYVCPTNAASIR